MAAPGPAMAVQEPKPLPPKAESANELPDELVGQECVPVAVQPAPPAPVSSEVPELAAAAAAEATAAAATPEPAVPAVPAAPAAAAATATATATTTTAATEPAAAQVPEEAAAAPLAPATQELPPVEVKEVKAKATKVSSSVWEDYLGLPDTPQPRTARTDKLPAVVPPPVVLAPSSPQKLSRKAIRQNWELERKEEQRKAAEKKAFLEEYARSGPRHIVSDDVCNRLEDLKAAWHKDSERKKRAEAEAKERMAEAAATRRENAARLRAARLNPPVFALAPAQVPVLASVSILVSAPSEACRVVKARMRNPRAIAQTLSAFAVAMVAGLWVFGFGEQLAAQVPDSVAESLEAVMDTPVSAMLYSMCERVSVCGPGGLVAFGRANLAFPIGADTSPSSKGCSSSVPVLPASVGEGAGDDVPSEEISSGPSSVLFQDVFGSLSCGLAVEEVPALVVPKLVPEEVCWLYEAGMTYGTGEGIPVCELPAALAWGYADYLLGLGI